MSAVVKSILAGKPVRQALNEDLFGMDDAFFTKEELLEFADAVVEDVNARFKSKNATFSIQYTGAWMENDGRTVTVDYISFPNEYEYSTGVKIDMRAIKAPGDLFKYVDDMAIKIVKEITDTEVE